MRSKLKAILILLLFVVLLSPIEVSAYQPDYMYPLGIVVEINPCEFGSRGVYYDDFIIDVVVLKEELVEHNTQANQYLSLPYELKTSEYADLENEWVSALLFLEYVNWENGSCTSVMFGYEGEVEAWGITQFKVVVYENGEEPVESQVFYSSSLATWDDPSGYKIIYDQYDHTFTQEGYEAELIEGYSGGFFNPMIIVLVLFIGVITLLFVVSESLIYMFGRKETRVIVISLVANTLVAGVFLIQLSDLRHSTIEFLTLVSLWVVPVIYATKAVLLRKYAYETFKVSVFFSIIFYAVYFLFVIAYYL